MATRLLISFILVSMVTWATCEHGYTDNNDDQWSYQWYKDESFSLICNSSKLGVQTDNYVVWETPENKFLQNGYEDSHYSVKDKDGVRDMELQVKRVQEEVHGVYICRVYISSNAVMRDRMILGLNIHDRKYHDLFDKYRYNLIVAVIATLVFVVPLSTICFVYQFKYRTPEEKNKRRLKKKGVNKFMYSAGEHPMKSTERLAGNGQDSKETEDHDNPMFTQL